MTTKALNACAAFVPPYERTILPTTSCSKPTRKMPAVMTKDNRVNGCCMHPFFTCVIRLCYPTNVTRSHNFVDLWLILNDPKAAAANPVPYVHKQKTAAKDQLCLVFTCAPLHYQCSAYSTHALLASQELPILAPKYDAASSHGCYCDSPTIVAPMSARAF